MIVYVMKMMNAITKTTGNHVTFNTKAKLWNVRRGQGPTGKNTLRMPVSAEKRMRAQEGSSGWRNVGTNVVSERSMIAPSSINSDNLRSLSYPAYALPTIQWYPGHIAKAERLLESQLSAVDVIIEVRDARCPLATAHPLLEKWLKQRPNKKRILVINRQDMIRACEIKAWKVRVQMKVIVFLIASFLFLS